MANIDLKREPVNVDDNSWWYEEDKGIEIYVCHYKDDGTRKFKQTVFTIPWQTIRAALKRKDK